MDVPDPASEEWIDQRISGLRGEPLVEVVATLRARGGRQAELVDRILQLRGKPVPSGGEEARASLSATVTDDTIVDTEPPVEGHVVEAARPSRQAQGRGRDLAIGARFAAHVIEGVAGRGGMGVVYRARQERPSRIVALKVISPELADDSGFRERFTRESELAASIEHSNVIPVYEVGEESHRLFIVMRYVEGTDLATLIAAEGRVAPRRAVHLLGQLASALDAAHARGLVHRDVKPANVLIAREGGTDHIYLTDFGLARFAAGAGQTRTGMFVGTSDFAAPEQYEARRVDARTDVYAAGCVLYTMLTGSVPFPREHEAAIMWAHLSASPPSVCDAVPTLPCEFDAVIARAMAKDPEERYPSAGDLGRDAVAAADRQRATVTEGSVATGRAAPTAGAPRGAAARTEAPPSRLGDAGARGQTRARSPGDRPRTALAARARSQARIAVIAAGVLIAIAIAVLAASGAFSTSSHRSNSARNNASNKPKLPPAPTTKTFADSRLGVSFAYPANWNPLTLAGSSSIKVLTDVGTGTGAAETRCALLLEPGFGRAFSSQQAQIAYVRGRAAFAARQAQHYEVLDIKAEQAANIAGVGLLATADPRGYHTAYFFRDRDAYVLDCIAPAAELNQVDQQAFRPLIASFRVS